MGILIFFDLAWLDFCVPVERIFKWGIYKKLYNKPAYKFENSAISKIHLFWGGGPMAISVAPSSIFEMIPYYEFVAILPATTSYVTGSPVKATMPGLDFSTQRDLFKINDTSDNIFWWKYCVQWHTWKCIFLRLLLLLLLLQLLLLFMCLCVLLAEARKRHRTSGTGVADGCGVQLRCWELNLCSLEAQQSSQSLSHLSSSPKHFLKNTKEESFLKVCYKVISQL